MDLLAEQGSAEVRFCTGSARHVESEWWPARMQVTAVSLIRLYSVGLPPEASLTTTRNVEQRYIWC